jgi:hypothetical protein
MSVLPCIRAAVTPVRSARGFILLVGAVQILGLCHGAVFGRGAPHSQRHMLERFQRMQPLRNTEGFPVGQHSPALYTDATPVNTCSFLPAETITRIDPSSPVCAPLTAALHLHRHNEDPSSTAVVSILNVQLIVVRVAQLHEVLLAQVVCALVRRLDAATASAALASAVSPAAAVRHGHFHALVVAALGASAVRPAEAARLGLLVAPVLLAHHRTAWSTEADNQCGIRHTKVSTTRAARLAPVAGGCTREIDSCT